MIDFGAWVAGSTSASGYAIDGTGRAVSAWRRIQRSPQSITVRRGTGATFVELAAQVVRVELDNGASEQDTPSATPGLMRAVVFGVRGHPTVSDTNLQKGDRFILINVEYEVMGVATPPGEVQAFCEARR